MLPRLRLRRKDKLTSRGKALDSHVTPACTKFFFFFFLFFLKLKSARRRHTPFNQSVGRPALKAYFSLCPASLDP